MVEIAEPTPSDDIIDKQERVEAVIDERIAEALENSNTSVAVGDYATWSHSGEADATSGSFDFAVDLGDSAGSTIVVDDSSEWVTAWDYAVPKVTETGVYSVLYRVQSTAAAGFKPSFLTAEGETVESAPNLQADTAEGPGGDFYGLWSGTVYLSADTHIDVQYPGSAAAASLFVQRIA